MNFSSQKLDERVHVHVQTPHVVQNYQCAAIGHKAAGLRSSFRHSRQDQMSKMNISQLMSVTLQAWRDRKCFKKNAAALLGMSD